MKTHLIRAGAGCAFILALCLIAWATTGDALGQGGCPCCGCPPGQTATCCECSVYPAVANCCCMVPTPPPQPTSTPGGPPTPVPTPTPIPPCVPPVIMEFCVNGACVPPEQRPIEVHLDCDGNPLDIVDLGGCGTLFCAVPTPAPPGEVGPCDPLTAGFGLGMFNCGGEYNLTATAHVPNCTVTREPWPKGMVTVPNTMELHQPETGAIGWSDYAMTWPPGVPPPDHNDGSPFQSIKDFRFGLRWRKAPGMMPTWTFGDGNSAAGWEVIHTYDRSSYGQPCTRDGLEAYCISTLTYWLLDGVTEWDQWECTQWEHECVWHDCNDDRTPHEWEWRCPYNGCSGGTNHEPWMSGHPDWERVQVCGYYDWVHHEEWEWIDLRELDWPTEYYAHTGPSDRLPVIEAQSVIDRPRP